MNGFDVDRVPRRVQPARFAALLGALCGALPAAAPAQERALRFELAPYTAFRFGGAFEREDGQQDYDLDDGDAQGLIFDMTTQDGGRQWEVLYARQRTALETPEALDGGPPLDIDAEYLQAGGTYLFDGQSRRPFVALTAGIARFAPAPSGFDDESYLSASLGGGVHLRADKRIGVRIEGRMFASLIDSDSELFCGGGAQAEQAGYLCTLDVDGTTLVQWEARVGLVLRF